MNRELTDLGSARVQTTAWARFRVEVEDENADVIGVDMVEMAFNSQMMNICQGSDLSEIANEMFTHMKMQIRNPALAKSRYRFDEVPFLDYKFHQLNLTRDSSYLPLPDWISRKDAVINPKNENDEECFKCAVTAALHHVEIKSHPKRILNLRKYDNKYDWSGLEFLLSITGISEFKKKNIVIINVLGVGEKRYIA